MKWWKNKWQGLYHTQASVKESKGYPPRKILDRGSSPSGRGLFGKIFPPFKKNLSQKSKESPPWPENFGKFWKIFEILVKESKGYPPLRGQKIYPPPTKSQKNPPPRNILSKSLPPSESGACPSMVWSIGLVVCLSFFEWTEIHYFEVS